MRYLILGSGAVGGVLGACLHLSGRDVVLVARGLHYELLSEHGMIFEQPSGVSQLKIPVVKDISEAVLSKVDVVVLAVKSQDTLAACARLAGVAAPDTIVLCAQNGVENERVALRYFENVYGAAVAVAASYLEPGRVVAHAGPVVGAIHIGRCPSGVDASVEEMAADITSSSWIAYERERIMEWKYAKLLRSVGNAVSALVGDNATGALVKMAQDEARLCFTAANISYVSDEDWASARGSLIRFGVTTDGSPIFNSSWQSLARGAGSVETEYLNGEVSLLGRLNGVATPVNDMLSLCSRRLLDGTYRLGSLNEADIIDSASRRVHEHLGRVHATSRDYEIGIDFEGDREEVR